MRTTQHSFAVFLGFLAAAVVMTWPLAHDLSTAVPDQADPLFNAWILEWQWQQWVRHGPTLLCHIGTLYDAPSFFPLERTLAFSESMTALVLLGAPLRWLLGEPVAALNALLLLSFALCGLTAFWLFREVTGSPGGAVVVAFLWTFAPYRMSHLSHLPILSMFWHPLVLLFLYRFVRWRSWSAAIGLGVSLALAALSSVYHGLFLVVVVGGSLAVWMIFGLCRRDVREGWPRLVVAAGLLALLTLPFLQPYREVRREHNVVRATAPGVDLLSFCSVSWRSRWFGRDTYALGTEETRAFPGVLLLLLACAGLARWWRKQAPCESPPPSTYSREREAVIIALLFPAVLALGIALGSRVTWAGHDLGPGPYAFLAALPGFEVLRAPGRALPVFLLALAAMAAAGWGWVEERLGSARRRRYVLRCAVLSVAALELWCAPLRLEPVPPPLPAELIRVLQAEVPKGHGFLILPLPRDEEEFSLEAPRLLQFLPVERPLLNGYGGFRPEPYRALCREFAPLAALPTPTRLRELGCAAVVVSKRQLLAPEAAAIAQSLQTRSDLRTVWQDGDWLVLVRSGRP
jgi:hypothetical protein